LIAVRYSIAAALLMVVFATAMAQARDLPEKGVTFDDMATWLRAQGSDAKVTTDSLGNKIVASDGGGFNIYLFDCDSDRCGSVQFAAGFRTDGKIRLDRVNEWNRDKRWARAYLDKSKNLWVEADFDLVPGGTYELLNDELATWKKVLENFRGFFAVK